MKVQLKPIFIYIATGVVALGTSFGITYSIIDKEARSEYERKVQEAKDKIPEVTPETPLTSQQKFLNSFVDIEAAEISGDLNVKTSLGNLTLDTFVKANLNDFENISVDALVDFELDDLKIPAEIQYFDSMIYVSYRDNYFKMESNNIFDALNMFPDLDFNLSLPSEFTDLDIEKAEELVEQLEETTVSGQKEFVYKLNNQPIHFRSDENFGLKGIYFDGLDFNGVTISGDFEIGSKKSDDLVIISPVNSGTANKYQPFERSFNFIKGVKNLFDVKKNSVSVNLDIGEKNGLYSKRVLLTDFDLSYDLDRKITALSGDIDALNHSFDFVGLLDEEKLYVKHNDIKLASSKASISSLFNYFKNSASGSLDLGKYKQAIDGISDLINNKDIKTILSKADKSIKTISLNDGSLSIRLNTSEFGFDFGEITPIVKFDANGIKSVDLYNLTIDKYVVNFSLEINPYKEISINKNEYVLVDPALSLIDPVTNLAKEKAYNLSFEGYVAKNNQVGTFDGKAQIDFNRKIGYGSLHIVDKNYTQFNICADVDETGNGVFVYNEELKGKFTLNTISELIDLFSDLSGSSSTLETIYNLFENTRGSIVFNAIESKDYLNLLNEHLIDNLSITNNLISFNIPLGIVGYNDKNINVRISYTSGENASIDNIYISSTDIGGFEIGVGINVSSYDETLESSMRLDRSDRYLDFSDIKVLVALGITTSQFKYYHFSTNINAIIPIEQVGIEYPLDLTVDFRIRIGDKVQISADIANVPMFNFGGELLISDLRFSDNPDFDATDSRSVSIYYTDETFYIKRVDNVKDVTSSFLVFKAYQEKTATYGEAFDIDYLLDNFAFVLMNDILGLKEELTSQLVKDGSIERNSEIDFSEISKFPFEKVLADYSYDKNNSSFYFLINMKALLGSDKIDNISVTVVQNSTTGKLSTISIVGAFNASVKININASLTCTEQDDIKPSNRLTDLENWVEYVDEVKWIRHNSGLERTSVVNK